MSNYWAKRIAKAHGSLFEKNRKQIDVQIRKYYQSISKQIIEDFEATYNKVLATMEDGKQPTPADLYKLDSYWKMQAQAERNLTRLGKKQISALTKGFRREFYDVYRYFKLDGVQAFNTIDEQGVETLLQQIWCSDGKSWSQRIWENTELLKQTLNEELLHCVATGKKPTQLKKLLQERFNVSYSRADALVRTELAHIQTQAAQQRYRDYGIREVEVLADKDERRCDVCGKLHGKRFPINGAMPVPAHPKCRCCIVPVVEIPKN